MKKRKKGRSKRPGQTRVGKRTAVQTPLGKKARVRPWRHAACSLPAPRRPAAHAAVLAPRPAPVPTPPWRLPTADCRLPQGNCSARMARRQQQQRRQKKIPPRRAAPLHWLSASCCGAASPGSAGTQAQRHADRSACSAHTRRKAKPAILGERPVPALPRALHPVPRPAIRSAIRPAPLPG